MDKYEKGYFKDHSSINTQRKLRAFSILVEDTFEKYGSKSQRPKILDVGCSLGHFLRIFDGLGFETYGIDIADYAIRQAKENTKANTCVCDIQLGAPFNDGFFDLITIFEVFEHLERPVDALKQIHRILKPDGLLILATSNTNSITRLIMGKRWAPGAGDATHVFLYTPFSLSFTLQRTMYRILKVKTPQIYPFFTHLSLPKSLLKVALNIPWGSYIWAVVQK